MKIIIPGIPVPQGRMRHSNFRGFVTTYDPKSKEKKKIREIINSHKIDSSPDFPRVSFLFHMPIPKSIAKRDHAKYRSGKLKHEKKPDVDNLIKLYLDCLDGIALHGDQKVSLGPSIKVYHPEPKTIIWIHETSDILQPWELDIAFLGVEEPEIPCFSAQDYPYGSYDLWTQVRGLFDRSYNLVDEVESSALLDAALLNQQSIDRAFQMNGH